MRVERLAIPDIILVTPARFADDRGFFSETYNIERMREACITEPFVQDNQSLSCQKGVVRGLHCQLAPHAQGKLVRCSKGAIWDVAVDIRSGSPTYGQWVAAELSEQNWAQLWIPPGFLHGFCTLTENAEVQYKCTALYHKESERSVIWNSAALRIEWPLSAEDAVLSEKDMNAPEFSAARSWF
ncbi:MAG: dTDP-4-dehydrorhamnose 3,5-epimerase [Acetobacter okinawensis]